MDLLRGRFITGLITIIPAAVTIWVIALMVELLNRNVGALIRPFVQEYLEFLGWPGAMAGPLTIGISLGLTLLFIMAAGILSRFFFIRRVIRMGEDIVERIPLIRFFYITPREVLRTLTANRTASKRVVMIEYPRKGVWCVAYATGELFHQPAGHHVVTVFLPTTPNPTSGFLLMVDKDDVYDVNLGTEDAVRFIISGGILAPDNLHMAPFNGLQNKPNLPPPEPLTTHLPSGDAVATGSPAIILPAGSKVEDQPAKKTD
ncbi:MAG: hypothetical protein PWP23_2416 [Candidatus Sumerlaeota bacterium]|nr:hypothetical protein [Candidatus Sumerlaeota bacterium]